MLDILLVDDECELREILAAELREVGHDVETASDGIEGLDFVARKVFDVVICDVRLPKADGFSVMRTLRRDNPATDVILMTAYADVSQAISALKEGVYDYLTKPFDVEELLLQIRRIGERRSLQNELAKARAEISGRTTIVGEAPAIRRVIETINMVSQSDAPTLVVGESGTGKELVAQMIHERSGRKDKPFIIVNCGALAENLIEAELFGHEKGAFTGAIRKRDGRFKAADGGTLFLDEVAELPLAAQAKLLRVLQEGTFEPVGTNTALKVDVRIISATHRNLRERIKSGSFREDLFYRINVIEIAVPPLRERPGDLPLLLSYFLRRLTPAGKSVPGISPAAWAALAQHDFPGNVREFSHAVEHAIVLSGGKEIEIHHLPSIIAQASRGTPHLVASPIEENEPAIQPLFVALRDFETRYLQRALKATGGKRLLAAQMLGISRKTLWEKLRDATLASAEGNLAVPTEPLGVL